MPHTFRIPRWLALTLIAAAVLACYWASLGFGFVYDDESQIAANPQIRSLANAPQFFTTYIGSHAGEGASNYYRPLFLLWLALNYALFALKPWGWHLTTVLMHVGACWLVYALARRYAREEHELAPLFAALLFAVHPVHVESVAWVSGVTDPLVAAMLLGAYLLWAERRRALSMLVFACALLTKETAIIFPVLLLAHEKFERDEGWASAAKKALPGCAVAALYLMVRFSVLQQMAHENTPMPLAQKLAAAPMVVAFYAVQLVLSPKLSLFHDEPFTSTILGAPTWAALLFAAALLGAVFYAVVKRRETRMPALWLLLPMALVMNVAMFLPGEAVHDRYLYLPSAGFVMLVAFLFSRLLAREGWRGRVASGAAVTLLAISGLQTASASFAWRDNLSLYSHAVGSAPMNATARNNLAGEYFKRGDLQRAGEEYQALLVIAPGHWLAYYNLGFVRMNEGRNLEATDLLRRAIALNPAGLPAYLQLARAQEALSQWGAAEETLRAALRLEPRSAEFHLELGMVLLRAGKTEEGRRELAMVAAANVTPELKQRAREMLAARP